MCVYGWLQKRWRKYYYEKCFLKIIDSIFHQKTEEKYKWKEQYRKTDIKTDQSRNKQ